MMYINKAPPGFFVFSIPKNIPIGSQKAVRESSELQEWVWVIQKHGNPRMRKIQVWVTYG